MCFIFQEFRDYEQLALRGCPVENVLASALPGKVDDSFVIESFQHGLSLGLPYNELVICAGTSQQCSIR